MLKSANKCQWVLLLAFLLAGACGCRPVLPPSQTVVGWDYSELPTAYDPETLYHYINGKARVYLDYGFVRLDHAQFASPDGKAVIDVDVYDMGAPEGAFGIYSLERGEELPLHYKKRLGYMNGPARFFWKGRYYVTITSPISSAETIQAIHSLSAYVENSIRGESDSLPILAAFPEENKIPESEQYFATDFLGYEFMGAGFTASYVELGGRFKLFLSPKDSLDKAQGAYARLKETLSQGGKFVGDEGGIGQSAFLAQDDYLGNWLVSRNGTHVVGSVGFQDLSAARSALLRLCRNLSP
jgi:hypothetical protein